MAEGRHTYRGWQINVFRQKNWPPYLDYTAYAQQVTANKVTAFNVDAMTPERCVEMATTAIDHQPRKGRG
jgi:hypothetical protein